MRNNNQDNTLKKNYISKYQFLIKDYERVKAKQHPQFRLVKDFYRHHGTCPQTFLKYYARYKQTNDPESLLPAKRGPKWRTRRPDLEIEEQVLSLRKLGNNRYEIHVILKPKLKHRNPSPSGVYQILKRHGKNRLTPPMKMERRKIIKQYAGQMGHIDCHHLSRDMIGSDSRKRYLVCLVDDYSRLAWVELVEDIKSLTVMFATIRCLSMFTSQYQIQFEEILSDNGPEFGTRVSAKKDGHPFERLLTEMEITHRYTRPYRPQTNGKVERFWRTLNDDLIEGTHFDSVEHFQEELLNYITYYNHARPHQGINGLTPADKINFNQNLSTN